MNNVIFSNFAYQNPQFFSPQLDMLKMPNNFQNMTAFVTELQSVVVKQQAIINALVNQLKTKELNAATIAPDTAASIYTKIEPNQICTMSDKANATSEALSETPSDHLKQEEDEEEEPLQTKRPIKIRRRNEFKSKKVVDIKIEEDSSSETSSKNAKSKNSNANNKMSNPSKAKHLWVNYGRRILEYALSETTGPMHERVKLLVGKLNSKRDFERAFQVNETDESEEKMFKTLLGKLAIYFVKQKASPTFESSKYKKEMVNQRHTVAAWIERLISG